VSEQRHRYKLEIFTIDKKTRYIVFTQILKTKPITRARFFELFEEEKKKHKGSKYAFGWECL
jgi:hypothetical protein